MGANTWVSNFTGVPGEISPRNTWSDIVSPYFVDTRPEKPHLIILEKISIFNIVNICTSTHSWVEHLQQNRHVIISLVFRVGDGDFLLSPVMPPVESMDIEAAAGDLAPEPEQQRSFQGGTEVAGWGGG